MSNTIYNTHGQLVAAGGGVAIMPSYTGTRTQYPYGWAIYRLNSDGQQLVTDPNAHWSDHGKMVFPHSDHKGTPAEQKRASLEAAKQWVAIRGWYTGEWARNRQRDYVPKAINAKFPIVKN